MGIQQNLADIIRMAMKARHMGQMEFSEELGISHSTLHEYLKGRGNPTASTLELLAQKLDVPPAVLVTGVADTDRRDAALTLLGYIELISQLPAANRLRCAELFLEMVRLWNADEPPA